MIDNPATNSTSTCSQTMEVKANVESQASNESAADRVRREIQEGNVISDGGIKPLMGVSDVEPLMSSSVEPVEMMVGTDCKTQEGMEDFNEQFTRFLSLDKCLPRRQFLEIIEIERPESEVRFETKLHTALGPHSNPLLLFASLTIVG